MKEVKKVNARAQRGVQASEGGAVDFRSEERWEVRAETNKEARREENSWMFGSGS